MEQFKIFVMVLTFSLMLSASDFFPGAAANVYAADTPLTLDYFIQNPDHTLGFWYGDNGNSTEFTVTWTAVSWNKYKKTYVYPEGVQDFFYYLTKGGTILETNSGWAIPESEWTDYPVIQGSNVVFKQALPHSTWSNEYLTKDAWGNLQKEYNSFIYQGLERVEIQKQLVPAAKVSWSSRSVPVYKAPDAEWEIAPGSSRGEDWYVRGLGLVKRIFFNDAGSVTSGFTLTNIWDNKRHQFVPIEEWLPVSMVILGELQGEETSAAVYDGNILIPVRQTFDYFGLEFTWDQVTKVLTAQTPKGPVTIRLDTSFSENQKDGSIHILPAPAKIIKGRLMVPVEFITEVLNIDSRWDKEQQLLELFPLGADPTYAH